MKRTGKGTCLPSANAMNRPTDCAFCRPGPICAPTVRKIRANLQRRNCCKLPKNAAYPLPLFCTSSSFPESRDGFTACRYRSVYTEIPMYNKCTRQYKTQANKQQRQQTFSFCNVFHMLLLLFYSDIFTKIASTSRYEIRFSSCLTAVVTPSDHCKNAYPSSGIASTVMLDP